MEPNQLPADVERLRSAKMYREAFLRLGQYRAQADSEFLRHQAALCLGSAAELRIYLADRLGIVPPAENLARMVEELHQAIALDDGIAYLHWNLAVIASRYQGDNAAANEFLEQALARDLQHPMAQALRERIDDDAPAVAREDTAPYRLREILFRLLDVTADETLPDETLELGDISKLSLDDYVDRARALLADQAADEQEEVIDAFHAAWAGLREGGAITADALDYGLEFVFRVVESRPGSAAAESALQQLIDYLGRFSMAVTGVANPGADDLRKGRRIARRGIEILDETAVAIDPDTEADLWLALGQCAARPQDLNLADALEGYTRALELKRKAGNQADVDRLQDLLSKMLDYAIQQSVGLQVGIGSAGKVHEEIEAAYEAARVLADEAAQLAVGMHYQTYLASVARPHDALDVLESLLKLGAADESARFDLLYEKAARLTEARQSAAAVEILQQLEPGIDSRSARAQCVFWNCYSNAMRELNKLEPALQYIDKAVAVKPEPADQQLDTLGPMVHTNRANILLQLGRVDEAQAELEFAGSE